MSYTALLLSLFVVDILAAMSPGPNFVLVTQTAVQRTTRHALAVVAGFVTTNFIWCAAVTLGLTALFDVAPWLYVAVKIGGGAYLIYLGIAMWRGADAMTIESPAEFQPADHMFGDFSPISPIRNRSCISEASSRSS